MLLSDMGILYDTGIDQAVGTEAVAVNEPPCRGFVHNVDVTPFVFVIVALQRVFDLTLMVAEQVTYIAHVSGLAYVATLPKSAAEKRVGLAHFAASLEGYPLTFTIEPA